MNSMVSTQQTSSILTMNYIRPSDCSKLFFDNIAWISNTTPIYHLEFCKRPILIRTLIDIINYERKRTY